jgi:radical SAM superfamily enzyme YgiQ (UPF0313 family)
MPAQAALFLLDVPGCGPLPAAHLMTSRGCPHRCSFCATARTHGRRRRAHGVERIMEDVERAKRAGARALWFHDDDFALELDRLRALCERLARANDAPPWCCSARLERLDAETLRLMRRAGCFSIFYGVESGVERVRRLAGKTTPLEAVVEGSARLAAAGIRKNPGYIVGFPTETRAEADETVRLMKTIGGLPALSFLRIYPGTEVEQQARERGVLPRDFSWTRPRRHDPLLLPALFGDAPLCFDLLTREDLLDFAAAWGKSGGRGAGWGAGLRALRRARSFGEALFLARLGVRTPPGRRKAE